MSFGQTLEAVLERSGDTQAVPAAAANVSSAAISKYIRGTRKPPVDVMRSAVNHYDDPALSIAATNEVTRFVPWLDLADLHKSNVHIKTLEEVTEAIEALKATPVTKRPDQIGPADRQAIETNIMESIEAVTALTHNIAVLCMEYGFSWSGVWQRHHEELTAKRYLSAGVR